MTYSPFRHAGSVWFRNRPIQLTLFLTRRCDARCPFCFYLSGKADPGEGAELSLGEITQMSASLGNLLWLAFSGGEIFLRDDLADVVRVFYAQNRPSVILLPTNGLRPETIVATTRRILQNCPRSVVTVKLSLDGLGPDHDGLRGVPGAFEKVLATHSLLAGLVREYANFELGVNTVFCRRNQDAMDQLLRFVRSLEGVSTHTVSLIRGNVRDESLKEVDLEKYRRTIARLETDLKNGRASHYRFRGAKLKSAQDIVQRRLIHRTETEGRQLVPCTAGRLTLVVTEKGNVYPCESFVGRLGNVRTAGYDLLRLVRAPEAQGILAEIKRQRCFCTHECYMMMNILFQPSVYPSLLREYVRVKGWL